MQPAKIVVASVPPLKDLVDEVAYRKRVRNAPGGMIPHICRGVLRENGFPENDMEFYVKELHKLVSYRGGKKKKNPRAKQGKLGLRKKINKTPTLEELEVHWAKSDAGRW
ncbi:MAG: hypothetical protein AAB597_02175 [Patescibacteria group bacterium]